ncbi:MAG: ribosome biogenesis GTPase Der [Flavobacteriales bacterium]
MNNLVAIVGRPNVGKSTLFNRLTETRDAIIDSVSGVTRDRKYGRAEWCGRSFNIIDTGGYIVGSDDAFEGVIRDQVSISIEEAQLIVFMVDVTTGVTDHDRVIADLLRRADRPVMLVSNKVDTSIRENDSFEFYELGLADQIHSISANNGYGTGEFLDALIEQLPKVPVVEDDETPRLAVVGRPNVGKSTFVNTLLGQERNIVTDIAGTTRDAIDTRFNAFGFDLIITDTAGLRKKKQIEDQLEFYSTVRTINAIERSDVCILLIDGSVDLGKQDLAIFWQCIEAKKGIVVVVNKWDLVNKDHMTMDTMRQQLLDRFAPFTDVPVVFTSNVTKKRILKTLEEALAVHERRSMRIPTSQLNDILLPIIEDYPPPSLKGKYIKIKYITQLPSSSPAFAFFCNLPQYIKDPYKRYLENRMREEFDFTGVPIRLFFRQK